MNDTSKKIPTAIVLFGGTGDLATNMLFPALYDLFAQDVLPENLHIYVYAHSDFDSASFRDITRESLLRGNLNVIRGTKILDYFLDHIHYVRGSFTEIDDYKALKKIINENDAGVCSSKLFYLSAAPRFFENIFTGLQEAELHNHCDPNLGWTRVVVEKPFGHDLASAKDLEKLLHSTFEHDQVFHVDHYLCKDMVRNMISFRFSNTLFEPLWNNKYIEKISIRMHEKNDVSTRGSFYDHVGAFRDVGQNHMLEMLAFMTMEQPRNLEPINFQKARGDVLQLLELDTSKVTRAQYQGYIGTNGVAEDSETETYFNITTHINNERWKGVDIELSAGKGLAETRTDMEIIFKESPCLCEPGDHHSAHQNKLNFSMKPLEAINLELWTKVPGVESHIRKQILNLPYQTPDDQVAIKGAYSKVLFDAIAGDQKLFTGKDEIYAGWTFTEQVFKAFKNTELTNYALGTTPQDN